MTATALDALASWATEVRRSGAPEIVRHDVKRRVLDCIGLQAAATSLATSEAVRVFVTRQGGVPEATAVGAATATSAVWAAFNNGSLAHSLDFDDTHLPSILHPSASIVPTVLAAGEAVGANGDEIIDAIAVGLEVTIRLGMAGFDPVTRSSTFFEHGQHATSICGTVGAATAAAMTLGLDTEGILAAMAVSLSMASGIIESNRGGGTVKRIHCGWAGHSGIAAAQLALAGLTGPPTGLEGRFGFFRAWLHDESVGVRVTKDLGNDWSVPRVHFKPYPANHFTHAAIDCARRVRERGVSVESIERIVLRVPSAVVKTIGEPIEAKRRPRNQYEAQFSGPYAVAASLMGGRGLGLEIEDFADERLTDGSVQRLMDLTVVVGDPECDDIFPFELPAILEVMVEDGRTITEKVLATRGGPSWPLTDAEIFSKYSSNVAKVWSAAESAYISETVMGLESCRDIREVMQFIGEATVADQALKGEV